MQLYILTYIYIIFEWEQKQKSLEHLILVLKALKVYALQLFHPVKTKQQRNQKSKMTMMPAGCTLTFREETWE